MELALLVEEATKRKLDIPELEEYRKKRAIEKGEAPKESS